MALKTKLTFMAILSALTTLLSQSCDAQTTVRPYQFGFTIEEQQHRYEKRDERGIVMGEFGFITADGIYHVTVYATDEEGRFRILAMKSYPYESPPKTIEMMIRPKATTPKAPITPVQAISSTTFRPKINFGQRACSGCFLKNKNENPSDGEKSRKNQIRPLSKTLSDEQIPPSQNSIPGININVPKTITDMAKAVTNTMILQSNTYKYNKNAHKNDEVGAISGNFNHNPTTQSNINSQIVAQAKTGPLPKKPSVYGPKTQSQPLPANTGRSDLPVLPNSSPANTGKAGVNGPPVNNPVINTVNGDSGDSGDLYRFKYILDYNGHTETGSKNGNKQGSFFSIGDDNVERTVKYIANEFGFQPKVRWRKVSPNEITSKENALKDYEFVWFKQS